MDNIVSIRKKIIKNETEEEFYLNPCDIFVTGKIYGKNSNPKAFHYLPFHEFLVVLFDDFISIFDLKKSIFENLTILKQFKISEIYNYFFGDLNGNNNNTSLNNPFNKSHKNEHGNSESLLTRNSKTLFQDQQKNSKEITEEDWFNDKNFNFNLDEQNKDIRFFQVWEDPFDKNLLFFIEFLNKDFIVFKVKNIFTDIFCKQNNFKIKNDIKQENAKKNNEINFDNKININENLEVSKKDEEKLLKRKTRRNEIQLKNLEHISHSDSNINSNNDSDFKITKKNKNNTKVKKSETKKTAFNKRKNSSYDSSSSEREIEFNNEIGNENDKISKEDQTLYKNTINLDDLNYNRDLAVYLKLDLRNYFDYKNYSFDYIREDLKLNYPNELCNKNYEAFRSQLKNTYLFPFEIHNKNENLKTDKKKINFLNNGISNIDYNANMQILELDFNYENSTLDLDKNNEVKSRCFYIIFRSHFNCIFINKIDLTENYVQNEITNHHTKHSFTLFKEYTFKILNFKIFKYHIGKNNFLIIAILIDENNDIVIESYFFSIKNDIKCFRIDNNTSNIEDLNQSSKRSSFNKDLYGFNISYINLYCEKIDFSNNKIIKNNENSIFDPSIISDINTILKEDSSNNFSFILFITKIHSIYIFNLNLQMKDLLILIDSEDKVNKLDLINNNISKKEFNFFSLNFITQIKIKAFEELQNQIKNTFVVNNFLYCFDIKGNYSFYYLNNLIDSASLQKNDVLSNGKKYIEIKNLKSLKLTREIYDILPFITEKGFFILNSYNILKNQDFSINYFIPINLQVTQNFICKKGAFDIENNLEEINKGIINQNISINNHYKKKAYLESEKIYNFRNKEYYNLIGEYLIRKLRIPTSNSVLFEFTNENIDKELIIVDKKYIDNNNSVNDFTNSFKNENTNLLKLRVEYYLNRLKYKSNALENYKILKLIKVILDNFIQNNSINQNEENVLENNFKSFCEICNDENLTYYNDEFGYICKNDHFTPCCCLTKTPLINLNVKGEKKENCFYKCNFCDLYYEGERNHYVIKFKICAVCLNYLNRF